jgi:light-regulated signal transduction histidine kinase (bacteriophytochrome)
MKVKCSFSFAVIVDRRLWALIACHHPTAKRIPVSQRTACEMIANAFAGQARLIEDNELKQKEMDFLIKLSSIFEDVLTGQPEAGELLRRHQAIFEAFRSTGVAVVRGSQVDFAGLCPPRTDLQKYAGRFLAKMNAEHLDVVATESLAEEFYYITQLPRLACGTLAVRISEDAVAFLFRPELIETIVWGGDPRKQLDRKNLSGRINPRTSFEAWEETIGNRSLPWTNYEIDGFQRLKSLIFEKLRLT